MQATFCIKRVQVGYCSQPPPFRLESGGGDDDDPLKQFLKHIRRLFKTNPFTFQALSLYDTHTSISHYTQYITLSLYFFLDLEHSLLLLSNRHLYSRKRLLRVDVVKIF